MSAQNGQEMASLGILPTKEYVFDGDWRDSGQICRDGAERTYVNQNHAGVVKDGEVIHSDGLSDCSAIILENIVTGEASLVHVYDWKINDTQYRELSQLSKGQYKLYVVRGGASTLDVETLMNESISDFEKKFADSCEGEIVGFCNFKIDTGRHHWSVSYDAEMRTIRTHSRKDNKVREFDLNKLSQ